MNTHNLDYRTTIDANKTKDVMYENIQPGDNVHQLLDKNVVCINSKLIQDRNPGNTTSSREFIKSDPDELEDGELKMENHQLHALRKYGRTISTPNIVTMSKESNQDVPYVSTRPKHNCVPIDLTNSDEDEFEEGEQETENLQILRNYRRTISTPNIVTMTKEPSQDATCISTRSKSNCLRITKASHDNVNCNPVKSETLVHLVSKESNVDVICKSTRNESNSLLEYREADEHTDSKSISTKTDDLPESEESDVDLLYSYYTCVSPDRSEEKLFKEIKSEPWIKLSDLQGILPGDRVKAEDDFKMTQSPTKCDRDVMKQEYTEALLDMEQYSREDILCVQDVNTDQTSSSSRFPDHINDFKFSPLTLLKPRVSTETNKATWQPVVILTDLCERNPPNYFKQDNTFSPHKRKRGPEDIQSCEHRAVPSDSSRYDKRRAWPSISTGTVSLDTVTNPGGKTKTSIGKWHNSLPHVKYEIITAADIALENTPHGNGTMEKLTKTLSKTKTRTEKGRNTSPTLSDISLTNPDPIFENILDDNGTPEKLTHSASKTEKIEGKKRNPSPPVSAIRATNPDLVKDNTLGDDVASGSQKQVRPKRQSALKAVEKIQLQEAMEVVDEEDSIHLHSVTPEKLRSTLSKTETIAEKGLKPAPYVSEMRATEPGLVLDNTPADDLSTGRRKQVKPKRQSALKAVETIQLQEAMEVVDEEDSIHLNEIIDNEDPDYEGSSNEIEVNDDLHSSIPSPTIEDPDYEGSGNEIDVNDDLHSSIPPQTIVTNRKEEDGRHSHDVCEKSVPERNPLDSVKSTPVVGKRFKKKCNICSREFWDETKFKQHRLYTHHKNFRRIKYPCDICQRKFRYEGVMLLHKKAMHLRERRCVCEVCGQVFDQPSKLDIHLVNHRKRYQCHICNTLCATTYNLKAHVLSHTGEKPHKCEVCEQAFSRIDNLKLHLKLMHKGVLRYECKKCNQKFKTNKEKVDHYKQEHPSINKILKRNVRCKLCPKRLTPRQFDPHQRLHQQGKIMKCDKCEKHVRVTNLRYKYQIEGDDGKSIIGCYPCFEKYAKQFKKENFDVIRRKCELRFNCQQCGNSVRVLSKADHEARCRGKTNSKIDQLSSNEFSL